jgi:hypothetical protein
MNSTTFHPARLGLGAVTLFAATFANTVQAATFVNPSFFGQANTTFQEWDGFTSPAGPNPPTSVSNDYGNPNWFDITNATDGAFAIGKAPNAHIYSFSGTLNLQVDVPAPVLGPGSTTKIVLQAEILGTGLVSSLFGVNYAGLSGSPLLPTNITTTNLGSAGGGFGGDNLLYYVEWDDVPAAASYSITYSPGDTSSSQYAARVDTLTTAVPEPGSLALAGLGALGALLLFLRRGN